MDDRPATIAAQTAIRTKLLDNGFLPLPIRNKRPPMKQWGEAVVTQGTIDLWRNRYPRFPGTAILLRGDVIALDIDIDDEAIVDELLDVIEGGICPALARAPLRRGSGAKRCYFARLRKGDEKYKVWRSQVFVQPGADQDDPTTKKHAVEVFSSLSNRIIGVSGAHTSDRDTDEIKVWYRWSKDPETGEAIALEDFTPGALPEITNDQIDLIVAAANDRMAAAGWTRKEHARWGRGVDGDVFDIADDTVFNCADHVSRAWADLRSYADTHDPRCSASFTGEPAENRSRCQIGHDHKGRVFVFDHSTYARHYHERDRELTPGELSSRIAQGLLENKLITEDDYERLVTKAEQEDEQERRFMDTVADLVKNWAFLGSKTASGALVRLDNPNGPEGKSVASARLYWTNRDLPVIGPKGGSSRVSPVVAALQSGELARVDGVRYRPDISSGVFAEDGAKFINGYRPARHDYPEDYARLIPVWMDFIAHLVPDPIEREWFLDWLAHKVQHPEVPGVAVMHYSPAFGTGRGTLTEILRGVFGQSNVVSQTMQEVVGQSSQATFNGWIVDNVLVVVEEAARGHNGARTYLDKAAENVLKQLVDTRRRQVTVRRKFQDETKEWTSASFLLQTNYADALAGLSETDRRFTVLTGPEVSLPGKPELLARVNTIRTVSDYDPAFIAAVWHWLATRDVAGFNAMEPLATEGKRRMLAAGETELDAFVDAWLSSSGVEWAAYSDLVDAVVKRLEQEGKRDAFGLPSKVRLDIGARIKGSWYNGHIAVGDRKSVRISARTQEIYDHVKATVPVAERLAAAGKQRLAMAGVAAGTILRLVEQGTREGV